MRLLLTLLLAALAAANASAPGRHEGIVVAGTESDIVAGGSKTLLQLWSVWQAQHHKQSQSIRLQGMGSSSYDSGSHPHSQEQAQTSSLSGSMLPRVHGSHGQPHSGSGCHHESSRRGHARLLKSILHISTGSDTGSSSSSSSNRRQLLAPNSAQASAGSDQYRRYGGGYGPYGPSSGGSSYSQGSGSGSRSSGGGGGSSQWATATRGGNWFGNGRRL